MIFEICLITITVSLYNKSLRMNYFPNKFHENGSPQILYEENINRKEQRPTIKSPFAIFFLKFYFMS